MAKEDYRLFTELDPGTKMAVAENSITWASLDTRNTDSYIYADLGDSHFSGDIRHTFEITVTGYGGVTPYAAVWGITNAVDDFYGIESASGDLQAILLVNSGGHYYLQLRICEDGAVTLQNVEVHTSIKYYVTLERDDDGGTNGTGRLTLRVYEGNYYGESGSVEIGTVTLDCGVGEQNDFRYLFASASYNTGDLGKTLSAVIENLDLNESLSSSFPSATRLEDIPEPKEQHGFEVLDGILYAVAGVTTGEVHSKTMYAFDPSTGHWTQKTDAPIAVQSPNFRAVGSKLYLIGGYRSDLVQYYDTVYEYNPSTDSWTPKTSMPVTREDAGSAVIGDKIYIFGGITSPPHTLIPYVDIYDPSLDSWETRRAWASPRCLGDFACAYVYNGKIYIVSSTDDMSGYSSDLKATTNVYEYDPDLDTFTAKSSCAIAVCYKEVAEVDGILYMISGATLSTVIYALIDQVYDVAKNSWKSRPVSGYSARGIGCLSYNKNIYFCGGFDNETGYLDYLYRLTPPAPSSVSGATGTLSFPSPPSPTTPTSFYFFNLPHDISREQ